MKICLQKSEDGRYDAYQVKTRKSELGEWEISLPAFSGSVSRFVALDKIFPGRIAAFYFVSNTNYSNSAAKKREHLSPVKLLKAIHVASSCDQLAGKVLDGFEYLRTASDTDADDLFSVLKRVDLTLGPTERAFEDELCQRHISTLPHCIPASVAALSRVRDSLIAIVARAASLETNAPSRDWRGLTKEDTPDPFLSAKRITCEDAILAIRDAYPPGLRFPAALASLTLGTAAEKHDILYQKMLRGGLAARYEAMRRRSITAEYELLDFVTRADAGQQMLSQIENVVLGECDDAHLRLSVGRRDFGPPMLIEVQDRLKRIAELDPRKVHSLPYEVLLGVAGLLTSDCKVWWSEHFALEDAK